MTDILKCAKGEKMIELMMQSLGVTTNDVESLKNFVQVLNELPPEINDIKQQGVRTMEEIEKLKSELVEVKAEITDLKLTVIKLIESLNDTAPAEVETPSDV